MATLFKEGGGREEVHPRDGERFKTPEMQVMVKGAVAMRPLNERLIMVHNVDMDVNGVFKFNPGASLIAGVAMQGDVLCCQWDEQEYFIKGRTTNDD